MLTITPKADNYLRKAGIKYIRFGVKPNKGCAGFEYIWEKGEPTEVDYLININDAYTLIIAPNHKKYVDQCMIDLKDVDDGTGYKIKFINDKVEVQCGCGESLDFPDDIREDPKEAWNKVMTFRFFHDDNNPWLNATDNGDDTSTISFDPTLNLVDDEIAIAGDTVKEVKPEVDLSRKYKQWKEAE